MPEWATTPDADFPGRVEPNAGKKATGFDDGEAPAASEHNWLFGVIGDWLQWFEDATDGLLSLAPNLANKLEPNLFERGQQIDPQNADDPMVATTVQPADNGWLQAWQWAIGPTRTLRLYWGSNDLLGVAALTVNAHWSEGSSVWAAEDSLLESFALLLRRNVGTGKLCLNVSQRDAAIGTWATWPTAAGDIAAARHRYSQTRIQQLPLNVLDFKVLSGGWAVGLSGSPEASGAGDEMIYALSLPHGAQVNRIHVVHTQGTTTPTEFHVYARRKTDWPAPGEVTPPPLALPAHGTPAETRWSATGPGSTGLKYTTSGTVFGVDAYSETLVLDVLAGGAGDIVHAIMVEINDPGPINKLN